MHRGAILHSDRGTQYTRELYRKAIYKYGIRQSMNSAGGRCHDNARCESMWARFKEELLYGRCDNTSMTIEQLKILIWRYFNSNFFSIQFVGKTNIGCIFQGIKDGEEKIYYVYNVCDHQECYKKVGSQAISYTTGVPAMIGAMQVMNGTWNRPGRM